MNIDLILRLLNNSGFRVLGNDGVFIYLEDPSCILRSFETFVDYAWIAVTAITGILLFGWAISLIRGAKNDILINLRNLIIIFGTLSAVKPAVNFIWGGDLFGQGCKTIKVSIAEVQKILDARKLTLKSRNEDDLHEDINIYDSGAIDDIAIPVEIPYSEMPVYSAGDIQPVSIEPNRNQTPIPSGYDGNIWGGQCTPEKKSKIFANQTFTTGQFANTDPAFEKALNVVFRTEGGYVNDPFDSGGETKYGVSKNNNRDIDVKNLTRGGAEQIAYDRYYKKYGIDKLPDGIRGEVFQIGWACGPVVAIKQLQGILNVPKTGKIDTKTIDAAREYNGQLRNEYLDVHRKYLIGITEKKPSQKKFIKGWLNRADLIQDNGCHS